MLSIGIGVMLLIATFVIYFLLPAYVPATQHSTTAAAPSTNAPAPSTSARSTPSATPVPRISAARWLHGLRLLETHMNGPATGSTSVVVTPAFLRSQAKQMRRCSPELARLGPPVARLEPAFRLAAQACGQFEQAANCLAGAARAFDPSSPTAQFNKLLNCGIAGENEGSLLIGEAVATGSGS